MSLPVGADQDQPKPSGATTCMVAWPPEAPEPRQTWVVLDRDALTLTGHASLEDTSVPMEDVIGWQLKHCHNEDKEEEEEEEVLSLTISRTEKVMTKKKELSVYRVETLELRSDKGHESTLRKWQEELEWIKCTAATGRKLDRAKTLLVLLNPKSGIGQASKIFTEQVEPLLQGCGLEYTVCVTERPGHARDIAAEKAFADRHSAVLIVAGDGLVHEVVAGMMSASSPAPVPLAVVAGGSGNGLVASLVDLWGHAFINYGVMSSAVKLCRGDIRSLDLIQITTQSGRTIHIVNSFGIGFIADMDIDSDNLRWIGEIRFFLYGTIGLITLPAYRVKLSYLPASSASSSWVDEEDDFIAVHVTNMSHITSAVALSPAARPDDGVMWLMLVRRRNVTRFSFLRMLLTFFDCDAGGQAQALGAEVVPVKALSIHSCSSETRQVRMTVDGEATDYEPFKAEVMPGSLGIVA